jgi:hypothetical protein
MSCERLPKRRRKYHPSGKNVEDPWNEGELVISATNFSRPHTGYDDVYDDVSPTWFTVQYVNNSNKSVREETKNLKPQIKMQATYVSNKI